MTAYLVIREDSKWSDVFRLVPGRTVTLGRAPTNQVVIKDERCSRYHSEIFLTQNQWTLRDLDSRNGTLVSGKRIEGDRPLSPGDIVRIANTQLAFVFDISKAFAEPSSILQRDDLGDETVITAPDDNTSESVLDFHEPTTITHRRNQTKYLDPTAEATDEDSGVPKVGRSARKLCRLAFELANQPDALAVAKLALNGLFESTAVDAGAVLLMAREHIEQPVPSNLKIIASRTDVESSYHRVSNFLAETALEDGEAVLARNVQGDSKLGIRDSKGEILATSVICAPIRQDKKTIGLIHLYATSETKAFDPDDLEFTLAVAENVALALKTLDRQQELTENLTKTQKEIVQLREQLGTESEIIGTSPQLVKVHQAIARAAPSKATVLIRGESGVGKELVARAVHFASPRKKGPFKCLNCAALSESLLESELFGHERGSFTGATERKVGKFEAANTGTLMLDEIGEMSPSTQAKFLRVLEGHAFERVGGAQAIKADVRVIAATNRDLEVEVSEGRFRRDLYFRLHVVEIIVPPLRRRPPDILDLAHHFLDRYNAETGRKINGFTPEAVNQLQQYRWPGNVRELKNVIERAVLLARGDQIEIDDLTLSNLATSSDSGEMPFPAHSAQSFEPKSLADIEKIHIRATLKATGWNKSRSASILGIERSTLDRKIRRYEIEKE